MNSKMDELWVKIEQIHCSKNIYSTQFESENINSSV